MDTKEGNPFYYVMNEWKPGSHDTLHFFRYRKNAVEKVEVYAKTHPWFILEVWDSRKYDLWLHGELFGEGTYGY